MRPYSSAHTPPAFVEALTCLVSFTRGAVEFRQADPRELHGELLRRELLLPAGSPGCVIQREVLRTQPDLGHWAKVLEGVPVMCVRQRTILSRCTDGG